MALVAVPRDGSAEFPLFRHEQIRPFHLYRQRRGLKNMLDGPGGVAAVEGGLRDVLDRYEHNRLRGHHDAPPLRSVRLYRVDYRVEPDEPDLLLSADRTFIAEVAAAPAREGM